jgi:hypothetical protein
MQIAKCKLQNEATRIVGCGLVLMILIVLCGCDRKAATGFESTVFERVEVIGKRGAGVGEFNKPRSLAVDREDNVYVVDLTGAGSEIFTGRKVFARVANASNGQREAERYVPRWGWKYRGARAALFAGKSSCAGWEAGEAMGHALERTTGSWRFRDRSHWTGPGTFL